MSDLYKVWPVTCTAHVLQDLDIFPDTGHVMHAAIKIEHAFVADAANPSQQSDSCLIVNLQSQCHIRLTIFE